MLIKKPITLTKTNSPTLGDSQINYCPLMHLVTLLTTFQSQKMDSLYSKIEDEFIKLQSFNFDLIKSQSFQALIQTYYQHLMSTQYGIRLLKLVLQKINKLTKPNKYVQILELLSREYRQTGEKQLETKIMFEIFEVGMTLKHKIFKTFNFGVKALEMMNYKDFQKNCNSIVISIKNQLGSNNNKLIKNISQASSVYGCKLIIKQNKRNSTKQNHIDQRQYLQSKKIFRNSSNTKRRNYSLHKASGKQFGNSFHQENSKPNQHMLAATHVPKDITNLTNSHLFKQSKSALLTPFTFKKTTQQNIIQQPHIISKTNKNSSKFRSSSKTLHLKLYPKQNNQFCLNMFKNKIKTKTQLLPYHILLHEVYCICSLRFKSELKKKYFKDFKDQLKQKIVRQYPGRNIQQVLFDIELEKLKVFQNSNELKWTQNKLSRSGTLKKRKMQSKSPTSNQNNSQIIKSNPSNLQKNKNLLVIEPNLDQFQQSTQSVNIQQETNKRPLSSKMKGFYRSIQFNCKHKSNQKSHLQQGCQNISKIQSKNNQKDYNEPKKQPSQSRIRTRKIISKSEHKSAKQVQENNGQTDDSSIIKKLEYKQTIAQKRISQQTIQNTQNNIKVKNAQKQKKSKGTLKKVAKNLINQKRLFKNIQSYHQHKQAFHIQLNQNSQHQEMNNCQSIINHVQGEVLENIQIIQPQKIIQKDETQVQPYQIKQPKVLQDQNKCQNSEQNQVSKIQIQPQDINSTFNGQSPRQCDEFNKIIGQQNAQKQVSVKLIQVKQPKQNIQKQNQSLNQNAQMQTVNKKQSLHEKQFINKIEVSQFQGLSQMKNQVQQFGNQSQIDCQSLQQQIDQYLQYLGNQLISELQNEEFQWSYNNKLVEQKDQNNFSVNQDIANHDTLKNQRQVKSIQNKQIQDQKPEQQEQYPNINISISVITSSRAQSTKRSVFSQQKIRSTKDRFNNNKIQRQNDQFCFQQKFNAEEKSQEQQNETIKVQQSEQIQYQTQNNLKQDHNHQQTKNNNSLHIPQIQAQSSQEQEQPIETQQEPIEQQKNTYLSGLYDNLIEQQKQTQNQQQSNTQEEDQQQQLKTKTPKTDHIQLISKYEAQKAIIQQIKSAPKRKSRFSQQYADKQQLKHLAQQAAAIYKSKSIVQSEDSQQQNQQNQNNKNQLQSQKRQSLLAQQFLESLQNQIIANELQNSKLQIQNLQSQGQFIQSSAQDLLQLKQKTQIIQDFEEKSILQQENNQQQNQKIQFQNLNLPLLQQNSIKDEQNQLESQQSQRQTKFTEPLPHPPKIPNERSSIQDSLAGMADLVKNNLINSNNLLGSNMNISTKKSIIKSDSKIRNKNNMAHSPTKQKQSGQNNTNQIQKKSEADKKKSVKISMVPRQQTISTAHDNYQLVINHHILKPHIRVSQNQVTITIFNPYQMKKCYKYQKQFTKPININLYIKGLQSRLIKQLNKLIELSNTIDNQSMYDVQQKSTNTVTNGKLKKNKPQSQNGYVMFENSLYAKQQKKKNRFSSSTSGSNKLELNWDRLVEKFSEINLQSQLVNLKTFRLQYKRDQFLTVNLMHYLEHKRLIIEFKKNPLQLHPIQISLNLNQSVQDIKSLFTQKNVLNLLQSKVKIQLIQMNNQIKPTLQVYNLWCHIQTLGISLKNSNSKLKSMFKLNQFVYKSQDATRYNMLIEMIQHEDQMENLIIQDLDLDNRNKVINNFSVIVGYAVKIVDKHKAKFVVSGKEIKQFLHAL